MLLPAGCRKQVPAIAPEPAMPEESLFDPWAVTDISDCVHTAPSGYSTVTAVSGGTRSHLQESGDSKVSVLWTEGDTFTMLTKDSKGDFYIADYSTTDSGARADFQTHHVLPDNTASYHCLSPALGNLGYANGILKFGVTVPVEQNAVPGGIEEGLNVSYAYTEDKSADLQFRNVLSLLRFKLSGPGVSTLDHITFKGSDQIAGDFVAVPEDGIAYITERHFGSDVSSNTITLGGPFSTGEYYYVILVPGERPLKLTFYDSDGRNCSVISSSLNFTRAHVTDIGTITLGNDFYSGSGQSVPEAELYMQASSGYKPVSLVVVPDGFKRDQLDEYAVLARGGIDYLFDTEPFKSYKEFFNVWILYVESSESGASVTDGKGNITENHDCYFESRWGDGSYFDMELNEATLNRFVESKCPDIADGSHTRGEVPKLVIINDERYGGICHIGSGEHRYCMVPYAFGGRRITFSSMEVIPISQTEAAGVREATDEDYAEMGVNNGDWRNLVLHEFGGHCISRLMDEYWYTSYKPKKSSIPYHGYTIPYALNISADYSPTPWDDDLMSRRDALIAVNPLYARIGSFQGGDGSVYNRWRSEFISCMIDNRPYFSTWQRELIVRHIFDLAGAPFNLQDFLAKDVIFDPIRDASHSNAPGLYREGEPCREGPHLPPPVYSDAL